VQYPPVTSTVPITVCCNKDDTGSTCLTLFGAAANALPYCCPKQQQCNVLVGKELQTQCCMPGDQCVADTGAAVAGAQVCKPPGQVECDPKTQVKCTLANGTVDCCDQGECCCCYYCCCCCCCCWRSCYNVS
jgi:hypothetical protein